MRATNRNLTGWWHSESQHTLDALISREKAEHEGVRGRNVVEVRRPLPTCLGSYVPYDNGYPGWDPIYAKMLTGNTYSHSERAGLWLGIIAPWDRAQLEFNGQEWMSCSMRLKSHASTDSRRWWYASIGLCWQISWLQQQKGGTPKWLHYWHLNSALSDGRLLSL